MNPFSSDEGKPDTDSDPNLSSTRPARYARKRMTTTSPLQWSRSTSTPRSISGRYGRLARPDHRDRDPDRRRRRGPLPARVRVRLAAPGKLPGHHLDDARDQPRVRRRATSPRRRRWALAGVLPERGAL